MARLLRSSLLWLSLVNPDLHHLLGHHVNLPNRTWNRCAAYLGFRFQFLLITSTTVLSFLHHKARPTGPIHLLPLGLYFLSIRHPYYQQMPDQMVSRSHRFVTGLDDPQSLSFAVGCYPRALPAGGLRPDNRRKYGVLLAHTMYQSEAVRKHTVWHLIVQMMAAFRRTIAATTTLALYFITSGALSLFVLCLPPPTHRPNPFAVFSQFYVLSLSVSTAILMSASC